MKFSTDWHFNNEVCELLPLKIEDLRGFFSEVYQKSDFEDLGISVGTSRRFRVLWSDQKMTTEHTGYLEAVNESG